MAVTQERNAEMVALLSADFLSMRHINLPIFITGGGNSFGSSYTKHAFNTTQFNGSEDMYSHDGSGILTFKKKGIYLITGSVSVRIQTLGSVGIDYGPYTFNVRSQINTGSGFGTPIVLAQGTIPAWTFLNISYGVTSFSEIRRITVDNTTYQLEEQRSQGAADNLQTSTSTLAVVNLMMTD